jgi:hypothetical protein
VDSTQVSEVTAVNIDVLLTCFNGRLLIYLPYRCVTKDPCFMYRSEWTYCVCCRALIPFVVPNTQVLSSTLLAGHSVLVDLAATGIRLGRVHAFRVTGCCPPAKRRSRW